MHIIQNCCCFLLFNHRSEGYEHKQSLWNLTGGSTAQQQNRQTNFRAIGLFWYQYRGFDTSRDVRPIVSKPLPLRRAERKNDPPRTPASVPPPPRHSGNTQHKNTVTQKSAPHCGDRSVTAPRKWKRILNLTSLHISGFLCDHIGSSTSDKYKKMITYFMYKGCCWE